MCEVALFARKGNQGETTRSLTPRLFKRNHFYTSASTSWDLYLGHSRARNTSSSLWTSSRNTLKPSLLKKPTHKPSLNSFIPTSFADMEYQRSSHPIGALNFSTN